MSRISFVLLLSFMQSCGQMNLLEKKAGEEESKKKK